MSKTVEVRFTERERFCIYTHFISNVSCQNGREQDEYEDIWSSLDLDEVDAKVKGMGRNATEVDFSADDVMSKNCELTKDEVGYFLKFCERPMMGVLSRFMRPIRIKVAETRDKMGLKAVPVE